VYASQACSATRPSKKMKATSADPKLRALLAELLNGELPKTAIRFLPSDHRNFLLEAIMLIQALRVIGAVPSFHTVGNMWTARMRNQMGAVAFEAPRAKEETRLIGRSLTALASAGLFRTAFGSLVRYALNRGNVLKGPLRNRDTGRWKLRVPRTAIHPSRLFAAIVTNGSFGMRCGNWRFSGHAP
jgi:hypothetical protein